MSPAVSSPKLDKVNFGMKWLKVILFSEQLQSLQVQSSEKTFEFHDISASAVVLVTLALQVASLGFSRQLPYLLQLMAFVVCQLVIFMASIQCRGSDYPWETFSFCSGCEYKLGRSYSRIPTTPRSQERAEFRRAE
ncbi:ANK_REP_REGION domain-containing protein, partial [Durusdinium trenchii]